MPGDDQVVGTTITTGADGICNTTAAGDDEIAFAHAPHLAVDTDNRLFAMDQWNKRIVSVKLSYHTEQTVPLP